MNLNRIDEAVDNEFFDIAMSTYDPMNRPY
jgi:hypothetical protein